jgi:hypothetical protein
MFARFDRYGRRLVVSLVVSRRAGRRVLQTRLGVLGSVIFSAPVSVSERIRFWVAINRRQREIDAKHPGRVTAADMAKVKAAIARRIPLPSSPDEHKLFFQATVVRDAMAALDALEHAEDAAEEAGRQLERMTGEGRQHRSEHEGELLAPTDEERRP